MERARKRAKKKGSSFKKDNRKDFVYSICAESARNALTGAEGLNNFIQPVEFLAQPVELKNPGG